MRPILGAGSSHSNVRGRGWALPSVERSNETGNTNPITADARSRHHPYPQHAGRTGTDVHNNVGSTSHVRSRGRAMGNLDQVGRH